MTAMEYAIRDACDGDRRPNAAREMLTVGECMRAYSSESDGYAHPDDHIDRLGRLFVALQLHEKYGITFERWLEMIENGSWELTFGKSA